MTFLHTCILISLPGKFIKDSWSTHRKTSRWPSILNLKCFKQPFSTFEQNQLQWVLEWRTVSCTRNEPIRSQKRFLTNRNIATPLMMSMLARGRTDDVRFTFLELVTSSWRHPEWRHRKKRGKCTKKGVLVSKALGAQCKVGSGK